MRNNMEEMGDLKKLSKVQRIHFNSRMQVVFENTVKLPGFPSGSRNEATVKMNLQPDVYLKVVFDFYNAESQYPTGNIIDVYYFDSIEEYENSAAIDYKNII